MKEILEGCKNSQVNEQVKLLDELGFNSVKEAGISRFNEKQYTMISPQKIADFLKRRILRGDKNISNYEVQYDKKRILVAGYVGRGLKQAYRSLAWVETPISEVEEAPPLNILQIMKKQIGLNHFDELTIATVREVSDPFLIGRIKNNPTRFFIAQWGDDIQIDDLI